MRLNHQVSQDITSKFMQYRIILHLNYLMILYQYRLPAHYYLTLHLGIFSITVFLKVSYHFPRILLHCLILITQILISLLDYFLQLLPLPLVFLYLLTIQFHSQNYKVAIVNSRNYKFAILNFQNYIFAILNS